MDSKRSPILRLLAAIALIAAVVVVVMVVNSSLSGSDDEPADGAAKQEKAETQGSGDRFYFVQPGDSLSTIADKEGVDPEVIEQLNPDLDPQTLSTGQRVKLR